MSSVFDTTRCGLPDVERVDCDPFLSGGIPDPPPDIPDCHVQLPAILPPDAELPDVLCPRVYDPLTELRVGHGSWGEITQPRLVFNVLRGTACDFQLELDLDLPCPTFHPSTALRLGMGGWGDIDDPSLTFAVTRGDADGCDFLLDLDLDLPCPTFLDPVLTLHLDDTTIPADPPLGTFEVVRIDADGCVFRFDVDITFPRLLLEVDPVPTIAAFPGPASIDFRILEAIPGLNYKFGLDVISPGDPDCPDGTLTDTLVFVAKQVQADGRCCTVTTTVKLPIRVCVSHVVNCTSTTVELDGPLVDLGDSISSSDSVSQSEVVP